MNLKKDNVDWKTFVKEVEGKFPARFRLIMVYSETEKAANVFHGDSTGYLGKVACEDKARFVNDVQALVRKWKESG